MMLPESSASRVASVVPTRCQQAEGLSKPSDDQMELAPPGDPRTALREREILQQRTRPKVTGGQSRNPERLLYYHDIMEQLTQFLLAILHNEWTKTT